MYVSMLLLPWRSLTRSNTMSAKREEYHDGQRGTDGEPMDLDRMISSSSTDSLRARFGYPRFC